MWKRYNDPNQCVVMKPLEHKIIFFYWKCKLTRVTFEKNLHSVNTSLMFGSKEQVVSQYTASIGGASDRLGTQLHTFLFLLYLEVWCTEI